MPPSGSPRRSTSVAQQRKSPDEEQALELSRDLDARGFARADQMKVLWLAEALRQLASQPRSDFKGPVDVLERTVRAEEHFQRYQSLLTDDPAAFIALERKSGCAAWRSPSVQSYVERLRRFITADPARAHWALGRRLNGFLDSMRPARRPRGRHAPRTIGMRMEDQLVLSLVRELEVSLKQAVRLGRRQKKDGKPLNLSSVVMPSIRYDGHEFFVDGQNWEGKKVPLFHQELAHLTERVLRREKGTLEQLATVWAFKRCEARTRATFREAVTWLRRTKDRVRWQSRRGGRRPVE